MPPSAIKTVRDLIYWQYAKLIAKSAGYRGNYRFTMSRFKGLQSGKINWSGSIREYIREREQKDVCIYCGMDRGVSTDHLIPKSRGGYDTGDNAVTACKKCNSSKSDKGLYEWFKLERKDEVPRIAEGKYLKLLYSIHEKTGTLHTHIDSLKQLCDICDVGYLCEESRLTVYCLESILLKR